LSTREDWIPTARNRLAQRRAEKPATKAGQVWALWPEIKACLDSGQSLKTVRQWLEEDAGLVLTERAFGMYVWRSRRKEAAHRTATAAEAMLRVHDRTGAEPPNRVSANLAQQTSAATDGEADDADPVVRTMQALRKRRFDIREAHRNGDPTNVKLI
jgi:hypothetical protein